jgi:CubicO group peptidase (beta-lactamase class C family)
MFASALFSPRSTEARVARATLSRQSLPRRAFLNPQNGPRGLAAYNDLPVRRASLAWASATASADGVARAYLPFASGGEHGGIRFLKAETLAPVHRRQGWSSRDAVLQKPLGWSQGFLKEERHLFCPNRESFGHAGLGGALGWCDPVSEVTVGYVMNRLDWHVRSPRALALCRALYECEPLR